MSGGIIDRDHEIRPGNHEGKALVTSARLGPLRGNDRSFTSVTHARAIGAEAPSLTDQRNQGASGLRGLNGRPEGTVTRSCL